MKFRLTIAVLVFMVAMARPAVWADNNQQKCNGNDAATWSGATSSSVLVGQATDAGVNMTSPTCLNSYSTFPGTLAVYTDVALGSSTCPDGTTSCTLTPPTATITNNPQDYTAFSQTQTYNVHFDASNATAGTYVFHVHANAAENPNLDGLGWGYGGGLDVTVTVGQPEVTCNEHDSLNVSFIAPATGNKNFCIGGTDIPVSINANDTSNIITSLTATVNATDITNNLTIAPALNSSISANATGTYKAGPVGNYHFEALAATACTTGSAEADVNLVYVISGLQPPLANGSKVKPGAQAPIKIVPRDCAGALVPFDSSVHIMVYDQSGTTLLQNSFYGGCSGTCASGQTDVHYDSVTGQYNTNFLTGAGVNTYVVKVTFGGVVNFTTTFSTSAK